VGFIFHYSENYETRERSIKYNNGLTVLLVYIVVFIDGGARPIPFGIFGMRMPMYNWELRRHYW
jgi:hypothetical protein